MDQDMQDGYERVAMDVVENPHDYIELYYAAQVTVQSEGTDAHADYLRGLGHIVQDIGERLT